MSAPLKHHEGHIARHLTEMGRIRSAEHVTQLLQGSGLRFDGEHVTRLDGSPLTDADCLRYLDTVKAVLGAAPHSFARVNFLLAGCTVAEMAAKSVAR
jgi:hypothetical protein